MKKMSIHVTLCDYNLKREELDLLLFLATRLWKSGGMFVEFATRKTRTYVETAKKSYVTGVIRGIEFIAVMSDIDGSNKFEIHFVVSRNVLTTGQIKLAWTPPSLKELMGEIALKQPDSDVVSAC